MSDTKEDSQTSPDESADAEAKVASLEAERDNLAAELERIKSPRRRRRRRVFVTTLVGVLVALSCILVLLSTTTVWAHRTLLNTDVFVGTVGPVFEHPAVDAAVATRVTDELFAQLHIQARLKEELPPKLSFAAAPITNSTKGFVTDQLTKVFASNRFQTFWTSTLRTTHEQLVAVLRGQNTKLLSTSNGYIVLNTVPVVNQALERVGGLASNLTGKHITLPTISSIQPPKEAVDKLSKALGVKLPSDFGQVALVRSSSLDTVQHGVRAFDRLTIILPLITLAVIALMLWISLNRRRTLVQFLVGTSLLLIVERRVVIHAQSTLSTKAHNPQVAMQVLGDLLHGFFVLSAWVLGIAIAILVVTLLSGPYRWAVALRSYVVRGWRWVVSELSPERRERALSWMGAHARGLQFAGAVVAAILLFIVSVSWVSFLVVAVLLAAFELWMQRLKGPSTDEPMPPSEPQTHVAA